MNGYQFDLPLCEHKLLITLFDYNDWVKCECGISYQRQTLQNYRDALDEFNNANKRLETIRRYAKSQDESQRSVAAVELGVSSISIPAAPVAPVRLETAASVSAPTTVVAPKAPLATPRPQAPIRVARPKRELPKLSPQQTLLTVAASLIVMALVVFLSATWPSLTEWPRAGVAAVVVIATAWGAVASKKLFEFLSNFFAGLSTVLFVSSLWYAANQHFLGLRTEWSDPSAYPYVGMLFLIAAAWTYPLSRRFDIFGWRVSAPATLATGLTILVVGPFNQVFQSQLLNSALLILSVLATVLISRRVQLAEPVKPKPLSTKKTPTEEEQRAFDEANYKADLQKRQRLALKVSSELFSFGVGIVAALQFIIGLGWQLLDLLTKFIFGVGETYIDPFGATAFSVVAFLSGIVLQKFGNLFIDDGQVKSHFKAPLWIAGYVSLASLSSFVIPQDQAAWQSGLVSAVLVGLFLHSAAPRFLESFPELTPAARVATVVVWFESLAMLPREGDFLNNLSVWFAMMAFVILTKAWVARSNFAFATTVILAAFSTLLPLGNLANSADVVAQLSLLLTVLGLATAWFALQQFVMQRRLPGESQIPFTMMTVIHGFGILAIVNIGSRLGAEANSSQAWMFVAVLALGVLLSVILGLASRSSKINLTATSRKALGWLARVWLFSGLAELALGHLSSTALWFWIGYSAVVFAILFSALRREPGALGLVSSFAIGIVLSTSTSLELNVLGSQAGLGTPLAFVLPAVALVWALRKFEVGRRIFEASSALALLVAVFTWFSASDASASLTVVSTVTWLVLALAFNLVANRSGSENRSGFVFFVEFATVISVVSSIIELFRTPASQQSLWLLTVIVAEVTVILGLRARKTKALSFTIATYASAAVTFILLEASVLVGSTSGVLSLLSMQVVPLTLALWLPAASLITRWIDSESKLPLAAFPVSLGLLGAAALTMPGWASKFGEFSSQADPNGLWVSVNAYALLGVIYLGLRLSPKASEANALKLLIGSGVTFVFGLFYLVGAPAVVGIRFGEDNSPVLLAFIFYLATFSVLLMLQALLKRESLANLLGAGLAVVSVWLLVATRLQDLGFFEKYSLTGFIILLASLAINKRTTKTIDADKLWPLAVVIFASATIFGYSAVTSDWLQAIVGTVLGAVLMLWPTIREMESSTKASVLQLSGAIAWLQVLAKQTVPLDNIDLARLALVTVVMAGVLGFVASKTKDVKFLVFTAALSLGTVAAVNQLIADSLRFNGPELASAIVATWFILMLRFARKIEPALQGLRSIITAGVPLAIVTLPSTYVSWMTVSENISALPADQLIRLIGLLVVGAGLLVFGIRRGNLGMTVVGGATLALNLAPNVWYRLADWFDGRVEGEIRALVIALVVFAAMKLIFAARNIQANSIIYLGVPVAIALLPALTDSLADINNGTLDTEGWLRFLIVLVGSMFILVVGALRKLSGLFIPGAVGVIVAIVPFAWKPLTSQSWAIWVILIVAAALLVWVAVRLEQFKTGAKSASSWMRELK